MIILTLCVHFYQSIHMALHKIFCLNFWSHSVKVLDQPAKLFITAHKSMYIYSYINHFQLQMHFPILSSLGVFPFTAVFQDHPWLELCCQNNMFLLYSYLSSWSIHELGFFSLCQLTIVCKTIVLSWRIGVMKKFVT